MARSPESLDSFRTMRKPLCSDSLLLGQVLWHEEREISAALRISRSALYRWMKHYGLPVAYIGRGLILCQEALSEWSRRKSLIALDELSEIATS